MKLLIFCVIVLLVSCTAQNHVKSVNATLIGWGRASEFSSDAIFLTEKGDTLNLLYTWYADGPFPDTGRRAVISWDSSKLCKKPYTRVKVKFVH